MTQLLFFLSTSRSNGKYQLSDVYLARDSDFGKNDQQFIAKTHLGNVLKVGDMVLGYDLVNANFNDSDLEVWSRSLLTVLVADGEKHID